MPKETKFTLALLFVLAACFGVVVWQKMEHQKKLLAAMQNEPNGRDHTSAPASPFDQFPQGKPDPKPGSVVSDEPRRLPFERDFPAQPPANPPANPFDNAPKTAANPTPPGNQGGRPLPPQDLFVDPKTVQKSNPAPQASPFNPFDGVPGAIPEPGNKPIKAIPASQSQSVNTGGSGFPPATPAEKQNPFDQSFPPRQNPPANQQGPTRGFPVAEQHEPAQPPANGNPFDFPGGPAPKQTTQVTPANETKPAGGFTPFTPVQHTEEKPTPPQGAFNPFDAVPIPEGSGNRNPPANEPPKGGFPTSNGDNNSSVPNPFDGFPMPERQPRESAKPNPPIPTPRQESSVPPRNTLPTQGFPAESSQGGPRSGDQLPARVYTVKADESYWSISQKLYGSARYFQALAEHNRHRVGDPKQLRPGMKILVPEAEIMDKLYARIIPGANQRDEAGELLPEGLFFTNNGQPMYRVGKEDTLSDIAMKHLGRASRWVEIYNLNKEKLPTPDRLKDGVVLKMPGDASRIVYEPGNTVTR